MSTRTQSIDELEHRAELSREAFARTVDQLRAELSDTSHSLRATVSPDAIKSELKDYAQRTGQHWVDRAKEEFHANPLRTVAIGALCAYPFLRLARSLPIPIVLIGAGLLVAERAKSIPSIRDGEWSADLGERLEKAGAAAERTASRLRQTAGDATQKIKAAASDRVERLQQSSADSFQAAVEGASELGSATAQRLRQARAKAMDTGRSSAETVARGASAAADAAAERLAAGADAAAERLAAAGNRAKEFAEGSMQRTPLVVAGLALVAGVVIAAALPRTRAERLVAGEAADAAKRRAKAQMNAAFRSARNAVGGAAVDLAHRAADAGAERAGDKVVAVAEEAVTTAFELPRERRNSDKQD